MRRVNKSQLVEAIAARTEIPARDVARVVDALIATIAQAVLRGEKVVLSRFGTFHRVARARRTGRDIAGNAPVVVPATSVPAFRPGKPFREAVARRRARKPATQRAPKTKRASAAARSTSRRAT